MVTCPIYNKEFKMIHPLHLKKHGITIEQFKEKYPNIELTSKEVKEKLKNGASERNKRGWETYKKNNPECSRMIPLYSKNSSIEKKEKLSATMKNKWSDIEYKKNMIDSQIKSRKNKNTEIEIKIEKQLINNKINFIKQKSFVSKDITVIADFYLYDYNLIIECNGDYWHCNLNVYKNGPINEIQIKRINIDKLKYEYYATVGFKYLVLWESDIKRKEFDILLYIKDYLN